MDALTDRTDDRAAAMGGDKRPLFAGALAAKDRQLAEQAAQLAELAAQLAELTAQLAAKDRQLAEQLVAQDRQLAEQAAQQNVPQQAAQPAPRQAEEEGLVAAAAARDQSRDRSLVDVFVWQGDRSEALPGADRSRRGREREVRGAAAGGGRGGGPGG